VPHKYVGRIWVDVEITANNFEEAKDAAQGAVRCIGFEKHPVDAEIYDAQWAQFFTVDGEPMPKEKK
jgi:hypothetical protein